MRHNIGAHNVSAAADGLSIQSTESDDATAAAAFWPAAAGSVIDVNRLALIFFSFFFFSFVTRIPLVVFFSSSKDAGYHTFQSVCNWLLFPVARNRRL